VHSIDKAIGFAQQVLDYGRQRVVVPEPRRVEMRKLVEDAAFEARLVAHPTVRFLNEVPVDLVLKLLDRLETGVPVRYFDVPRKASRDVKFYVEEFNVEKVPTFIFYKDGKELGRKSVPIREGKATVTLDTVIDPKRLADYILQYRTGDAKETDGGIKAPYPKSCRQHRYRKVDDTACERQ
jgi:hypothetical protein